MDIRLQGIGIVSTTKQAKAIAVGDIIIWNYGEAETVTSIIRETKSTVVIGIQSKCGGEGKRRLYKETWVAYKPKQKKTLCIAYGSNLNTHQMSQRCKTARIIGTSEVENYKLLFRGGMDGYAVATIEPEYGSNVPVLVWELEEADERSLDIYEGWLRLYRKENMKVKVGGEPTVCTVYIMNDRYLTGSPGRTYYNTILDGYKSAGFNTEILDNAVKISEKSCNK